MAIIKAPPKQPKSVTVQARVEESVKEQLDLCAKFIDSTPSYVITEALKVLFKRDDEFKAWLARPTAQQRKDSRTQGRRTQRDSATQMKDAPTQLDMRENTASSRRHASRPAMRATSEKLGEAELVENEAAAIESRIPSLRVFDLSLTESTATTGEEKRAEDQLLNG